MEGARTCGGQAAEGRKLCREGASETCVGVPYEYLAEGWATQVQIEIKPDLPGSSCYEVENGRQMLEFKYP